MSRRKSFDEFLNEANVIHCGKGYEYDSSTYVNTHTPMRIICPKHGEFWQTPKSHLLYECKKCSYEKRGEKNLLSIEQFIDKAIKKHGNKYDYTQSIYRGTKIPICIICPKHGEFWQTPNDHLSGKGCRKCNESKLEKMTEDFLVENKINFIPQYKQDWLGKQSLDFYLPDYNSAIECQGKQHFGHGGWSTNCDFDIIFENDVRKYYLCNKHGINLLYFVNEKEMNLINDNVIYKDKIFFNLSELFRCITEKR